MKKILLFVYFASIAAFFGYSQSLSLLDTLGNTIENNSGFILNGIPTADEMVSYVYVKNNTQSPVSVKVKKVELSMVGDSYSMFCWGLCFAPSVTVAPDPKIIEGDSVNKIDFSGHYVPNGNAGESVIRYVFFLTDNPSDTVCVSVGYSAYPLGIQSNTSTASISNAYPNPANDRVSFNYNLQQSDAGSVIIRNLLGSVVKETALTSGPGKITFNTGDLADGVYFYSLIANGQTVLSKKLVVKH
jgi:hypothetical protein